MSKEIPTGLDSFLNTTAERLQEDTEDIQSFCTIINLMIHREIIDLKWYTNPVKHLDEANTWFLDIISKKHKFSTRVFISYVPEQEYADRLMEDPYYMDISMWTDTNPAAKTKQESLDPSNVPYGVYTDPCRPLSWILTKDSIQQGTTIEEATLILIEYWKKYFLEERAPQERILTPRIKTNAPLRLVAKDGKILD